MSQNTKTYLQLSLIFICASAHAQIAEDADRSSAEWRPIQSEIGQLNGRGIEFIESTEASADELELLGENGDYYLVQLFASSSAEQANAVLTLHSSSDFRLFRAQHRGTTWYKVVSHSYFNKSLASNALEEFSQLKKVKHPWLRQLSKVHAEIQGQLSDQAFNNGRR